MGETEMWKKKRDSADNAERYSNWVHTLYPLRGSSSTPILLKADGVNPFMNMILLEKDQIFNNTIMMKTADWLPDHHNLSSLKAKNLKKRNLTECSQILNM